MTKTEHDTQCCTICVAGITDTKALQQEERFSTRIAKIIEHPKSRFNERDLYGFDTVGLISY